MRRLVRVVMMVLVGAASAQAAPLVLPGWPVAAPGGSVHQGPGGGPVVIAPLEGRWGAFAFRAGGALRWAHTDPVGCGNCEPPVAHPSQRNPDGSYGPIGSGSFESWRVDAAGGRLPRCDGVVEADGTCIQGVPTQSSAPANLDMAIVASRNSVERWRYVDPEALGEGQLRPFLVTDTAGGLYARLMLRATGAESRLVALDRKTGAFRWRKDGVRLLAGTADGVIAGNGTELISFDSAGTERWRVSRTGAVTVDPVRNLVFVQTPGFGAYTPRRDRIFALDGADGRLLWSSQPADAVRLLSIDSRGRVLVAVRRSTDRQLEALDGRTGRTVWRYRVVAPLVDGGVVSARELEDRTVAVMTSGQFSGFDNRLSPLLIRIDPNRRAPTVRRDRVTLDRAVVTSRVPRCNERGCDLRGNSLTVTFQMRQRTRVTIVVRDPSGRLTPNTGFSRLFLDLPNGKSFARILHTARLPKGRHLVEVRWRNADGPQRRLLPFTTV